MAHVRITLHIIVYLVRGLTYHVHGSCACCYGVRVRGSRYHRDCVVRGIGGLPLLQHLSYLIFIHWFPLIIKFKLVLRAAHSEDFEPIDFRDELCWTFRQKFWELFQENMWETCAKVCAIYI